MRGNTDTGLLYSINALEMMGKTALLIPLARIVEYITKDCPSCTKVVITVAPGIGYSVATGSGTQAELAQLVSRNFGSATLQAPALERRSR